MARLVADSQAELELVMSPADGLPVMPERFHPSASHIEPAYRDGWNHCWDAWNARACELEERLMILLATQLKQLEPAQALPDPVPLAAQGVEGEPHHER